MLLLDMMRNKKREENERKKVRPGIRDKKLSINPNYETLANEGKHTEELVQKIPSGGANPRDGAGAEKEEGG